MPERKRTALVRIAGRVQGVGFREWTRTQALGLGISGWVRNERDGSVSALLVGGEGAVAAMLERLWTGPPLASVTHVKTEDATTAEKPVDFRITR